MGYRRRTVLRGVGLAGVGGAALTAGCLDGVLSGFIGNDYTAWVPSPDELATVERFNLLRVNPEAVYESAVVSRPVESQFEGAIERALDLLGVPFDDLTGLTWVGHFAVVLEGSFRTDRLADRLAGADFRSVGSTDGYALYADGETLVGVSTNAVLFGPWAGEGTAGVLEAVVGARTGDVERYVNANGAFADLSETLGDGDLVVGQTGADIGGLGSVEAVGIAWRFDKGVAKAALAFVFPDGSAVDTGAIESLTQTNLAAYEDPDVGQRGRVGIVTATVPTISPETITPLETIDEAIETRPTATFEANYGSERRTATIIHAGGDAVPRSRLFLRGEGFRPDADVDQHGPGRWAGDPSGSSAAIEPGDNVTVGIYPDARLELQYRPIGRGEVITLGSFEPDAGS